MDMSKVFWTRKNGSTKIHTTIDLFLWGKIKVFFLMFDVNFNLFVSYFETLKSLYLLFSLLSDYSLLFNFSYSSLHSSIYLSPSLMMVDLPLPTSCLVFFSLILQFRLATKNLLISNFSFPGPLPIDYQSVIAFGCQPWW